jgi:nitroreductase
MTDTSLDPWSIALDEYPLTGTPAEKFRAALRFAVLAPSSHNSQPWQFRMAGDALELLADRARALPVVDPDDRELTISCGAVLKFLRVTLAHFGEGVKVTVLPDPGEPDLLARVELTGPIVPAPLDHLLFSAIPRRRTNRLPFNLEPIPEVVLGRARARAEAEQVWLQTLTDESDRAALSDLIAEGDRIQLGDRHFRRELASWVHSNRSASRDGMPGYALAVGDLVAEVGPLVIRTFDIGEGKAARDRQLALGSPALAVLWTEEDSSRAWLQAGQGLAGALLSLEADGISASYLNQAVELPELREKARALLGRAGAPQLVLRLGRGRAVRPTPRRSAEEVLLGAENIPRAFSASS